MTNCRHAGARPTDPGAAASRGRKGRRAIDCLLGSSGCGAESLGRRGNSMHRRYLPQSTGVMLVIAVVAAPAAGYIHFPPTTMPKLCEQSKAIRVLTVKKHNKEKGVIVFEATEILKGTTPGGTTFKHLIGKEDKGTKP